MPKALTPQEYLTRAREVHSNRYEYDEASFATARISAICPDHGAFTQLRVTHLRGARCPGCSGWGVDWIARFKSVHGERYDYSKVIFDGSKRKVVIGCPGHGDFEQTPDNHYNGKQGCPQCRGARIRSSKQLTVTEFIRRANAVHDNKYIYDSVQFTNMLKGVVRIECPGHGVFMQSPVNHLAGKIGCVKCTYSKSNGEDELYRFMSVHVRAINRDRTTIKPKELDIYAPDIKLAVEYCGVYHHTLKQPSTPTQRASHQWKYLACAKQGIRLITLYETEWQQNKLAVRRLIRTAMGKMRGRLMARKCELRPVEPAPATEFFGRYHPQGGAGGGIHYGLYWRDKLVACMRFSYGNTDRGHAAEQRGWALSRFATRVVVAGAASRLFKAFVREHKPQSVKSFSDNRFFSGGLYPTLGFRLDAELPIDYQVWTQKLGLRPKSHYQRRLIQQRLTDHGSTEVFDPETDLRTEEEMMYVMKGGRLYDCGKKRWLWVAPE